MNRVNPRWIAFLTCFLIICSLGCKRREPMALLLVDGHDIRQVVVLEIPRDVLTQKGFTPETLVIAYHVKLELRASALLDRVEALDDAVAKTRCTSDATSDDIRTAVLFYDSHGVLVRSVHYGSDPSLGEIDGKHCRLTSGLYNWTRTQIVQ